MKTMLLAHIAIAFITVGVYARSQNTGPAPAGKYAAVNGLKMYYEIQGTGEPVLLLHGAFGNTEGNFTLLPEIARTRKVINVDLEGHGRTRDLERPLTIEQMADDTAGLLKSLDIKQVDIFGYSMGGNVAIAIAIRHPELVRRFATLGSNAKSDREAYNPETYKQFTSLPADFAPPVLKEPYDRMAPDPGRWPVLVQKIKKMGADFKGFSDSEIRSIKAEALIMQGDRDGVRPEHAVQMFRMIPKAQLAMFPGGDHFMPYHSPEKVLAILVPFLNGVKPKSLMPPG
jgi:pimeloyl-ACP methyl ester carboxylesterase